MRKLGSILLIIVTLSCVTTIIVNYYTIKVLSAARSYVNGESEYSKGQKEATQFLISYIATENNADYDKFLKSIQIPIGDRMAREALSSGNDNDQQANAGFSQGKNHPDDIPDIIWLFKTFKNVQQLADIINIWHHGDILVAQLHKKGFDIGNTHLSKLTDAEKSKLIVEINQISAQLTIMQQHFSNNLGVISRQITAVVFYLNVVVTLLIISCIILFVWITVRKMQSSQMKIVEQNNTLQALNAELDKVIYNVSHDLRSPLAALTGLIGLVDEEDDIEQIRFFTSLMQKSVDTQIEFISDILSSAKYVTHDGSPKDCNLSKIIDDVVSQNNYSNNGKKLHFEKEIEIDKIDSDALKIRTILNNLISNAVKYSDPNKADSWIKIKTFRLRSACVIEVEDNGVGIKNNDQERIFDKFFTGKQDKDSNGIGLYLTKDAVEQMHGIIKVTSNVTIGTKFTIEIPCFNN